MNVAVAYVSVCSRCGLVTGASSNRYGPIHPANVNAGPCGTSAGPNHLIELVLVAVPLPQ